MRPLAQRPEDRPSAAAGTGALRCGLAAAATFGLLYSFLALLLLNVTRDWIVGAPNLGTAVERLRLVEVPVLLIDVLTGAAATIVGLSVAHRRGLGRGALLIAAGSPVMVAALLLAVGGRNGTSAALDLVVVVIGTATGAAVSRRVTGELA